MIKNSSNKIILVGAGGHCKSVIDVIESANIYQIFGLIDTPDKLKNKILDYEVIGNDSDIKNYIQKEINFHITVGHIKTPSLRIKLFDKIKNAGGGLPIISSINSHISKYSKIGIGTVIMHNAIVNADAQIGENCIINNKALIEHDSIVGNHCHISTNATVNGECKIGNNVFVGSGAVVKHGVEITDNSIIGAGAIVVKNIETSGVYAGCPAKKNG